jgi:lipoprotein NlpD
VTAPLPAPPAAESKPIGAETPKAPPPSPRPADAGSPVVASSAALVKGPKAQRLPYSEEALAQMKAAPSPFASAGVIAAAAAATTKPPKADALPAKPELPKIETAKVEPKPDASPEPQAGDEEDRVDWSWPANGKIVSPFTEGSNLKGIGVGGKAGQPVLASAAGKVVYAGSGLRGYGKLVIIKHNKTYLSVYAHNSEILVKEGQTVSKGQKIAEMGNTDAEQVKLHFEIRRLGKPVDPLKYLPAAKG